MSVESDKISSSIFYKPTDSHSYLRYDSHHPKTCKDSIPFSQFSTNYHPHNMEVKTIILNNYKLLQNDDTVGYMFDKLPLVSYRKGKNLRDLIV
jgi:hypothetical protein